MTHKLEFETVEGMCLADGLCYLAWDIQRHSDDRNLSRKLRERILSSMASDIKEEKSSEVMKWIYDNDDYNTWVCPNCNSCFCLEAGTVIDNNYNYCPTCGQRLLYDE